MKAKNTNSISIKVLLAKLKSLANPKNVAGMARFGINPKGTLGVSMPVLRKMGRQIGRSHELAADLWASGIHEARILAALIDDPALVSERQMDAWARKFDSWDVCDQVCMNLFDKSPFAYTKAVKWAGNEREFVRRAGFALMACLAWHDKNAPDKAFVSFLPVIKNYSADERNFVRKAVNWALRQIGKRNPALHKKAVAAAKTIARIDSKAARWIASDALREFQNPKLRFKIPR